MASAIVLTCAALILLSCHEELEEPGPPVITSGRVAILEGEALLGSVSLANDELEVDDSTAEDFGSGGSAAKLEDLGVKLSLVADINPPVVDGITLQASDIIVDGVLAYVAYNVRGATFLGAVQILSINQPEKTELLAEMIFKDADVHGMALSGKDLYLAIALDVDQNPGFRSPAALEWVRLAKGGKTFEGSAGRIDLESYAATDVVVVGDDVLVTSGDVGGGLSVVDGKEFALVGFVASVDARGVDKYTSSQAAVIGGTDGRVDIIDFESMAVVSSYSIEGAETPESKSTVQVVGDYAYLGAGEGGVKVLDLKDGSIKLELAQASYKGLPASLTVSNAITIDGNYGFVASGEAGVTVIVFDTTQVKVKDSDKLSKKAVYDTPSSLSGSVAGQLVIGSGLSANMVQLRKDHLFVASGLGGVSVIYIED